MAETKMNIRSFTAAAHFPRDNPRSTVNPMDRFEMAYKIVDFGASSSSSSGDKMNLVFIHGSQMIKELWYYYCELAHERFGSQLGKIVLVDLINTGDSAQLNAHKIRSLNSWVDLARDVSDLVRELRLSKELQGSVMLLGHSMGGAVSLFAGALEPGLIDGIVAFDPVWSRGIENLDPKNKEHADILVYAGGVASKLLRKLYLNARDTFESEEDYNNFIDKRYVTRSMHPRMREDMRKHLAYKENGVIRMKANRELQVSAYTSSSTGYSNHKLMSCVQVPVLIVRGDVEDWNYNGSNEDLAAKLPLGKVVTVEGGGHLLAMEQPDKVFAACTDFLASTHSSTLQWRKGKAFRSLQDDLNTDFDEIQKRDFSKCSRL